MISKQDINEQHDCKIDHVWKVEQRDIEATVHHIDDRNEEHLEKVVQCERKLFTFGIGEEWLSVEYKNVQKVTGSCNSCGPTGFSISFIVEEGIWEKEEPKGLRPPQIVCKVLSRGKVFTKYDYSKSQECPRHCSLLELILVEKFHGGNFYHIDTPSVGFNPLVGIANSLGVICPNDVPQPLNINKMQTIKHPYPKPTSYKRRSDNGKEKLPR